MDTYEVSGEFQAEDIEDAIARLAGHFMALTLEEDDEAFEGPYELNVTKKRNRRSRRGLR